MSGELDKPLVVGKAGKPRCFRNMDMRKLPVEWRSNKKGMDDVTDHGGMFNGFQWQNANAKLTCVVLG
jgi:hypothetical protein